MSQPSKPHRPSYQEFVSLEALAGRNEPIERLHAAHDAAAELLRAGSGNADPDLVERLITAGDRIGLGTLAQLWSDLPARSLPGALYRLYVLRAWVHTDPDGAACEYAAGGADAESASPAEVRSLVDGCLRGVFTGELAAALDRAALFCVVAAAGRSDRQAAERLRRTGTDLAACATLARAGHLE